MLAATAPAGADTGIAVSKPPMAVARGAGGYDFGSLALVTLQLAATLLIVYMFQIESVTFFKVMLLAAVGFVVHAVLPLPYRLPFFVGLSLAAIAVALDPVDAISVILLGVAMIGICHLPIRLSWRVLTLLALGALFAVWRTDHLPAPWSLAIWPVLGSMFMFRIALYLHALAHDEKRPTLVAALAYFFMLPNVCFPLFPVVDYTTFRRTYYDRDTSVIYATGMQWIVRGLVHLLLYRLVYQHMPSDPLALESLGDLTTFLLATFLLYLRVSGQFHLITGMLHLFGFRLPETHHLYFLASSFTDFWRRINIYWKDFMMKLVYYPSFFRLRRLGNNGALVAATVIVFLATWLLHSYQWFWLRGGFPLAAQDGAFWGLLGAFVVVGALREMKRSRSRTLGRRPAWSAALAFRTVATFTVICILWSLWSAESVMAWVLMWGAAARASLTDIAFLVALVCVGSALGGFSWPTGEARVANVPWYRRPSVVSSVLLAALVLLGSRDLYAPRLPAVATTVAALQRPTLNARDQGLQHKGYYENLDNTTRLSAQLWDVQARKPADWIPLVATAAFRARSDFIIGDLQPNARITFLGQPFSTNSFGMRNREIVQAKPPGVYRIAVLGPSHVMGSGVADGETFTALLEQRLNGSASGVRYEVLNFGVAGFSLTQQLALLHDRVLGFAPDMVVFTDSPMLESTVVSHLLEVVASHGTIPFEGLAATLRASGADAVGGHGIAVPYPWAREALRRLGIGTRMPWLEARQRMREAAPGLVRITLQQLAADTRAGGAVPVFLALDIVHPRANVPMPALADARQSGMEVIDLLGLWPDGARASELRIGAWDDHPNVEGDRMIADALFDALHQRRRELRLDAPRDAAAGASSPVTPTARR
jgi:hypothetical protein